MISKFGIFLLLVATSLKSETILKDSEAAKIVRVDGALESLPMIDSFGRERYFRGSNVVIKVPPFLPTFDHFNLRDSFADEDFAMFQRLDWNIVRLGFHWRGAEPEKGKYNETYFTEMKHFVERLNNHGIYVLLDFHQDLLSEKFCGHGVPLWAAQPRTANFPIPLTFQSYHTDAQGIPSSKDCASFSWSDYYFAEATATAFQALYDNEDGLLTAWAQFWQKVAKEFGHMTNVIGYNLMNEPFAGDIYRHPTLLIPGVADRKNLAPAYDKLAAAIRSVDKVSLINFEGVTWDNYAFGFNRVPGGPDYANRSSVGYHYYRPPRVESIQTAIRIQKDYAKGLKCGTMLTEFWALQHGYPLSDMIKDVQVLDAGLQSWIGWAYKPGGVWNWDGTVNSTIANVLSRPYAQVVAGSTQRMTFNDETEEFILVYLADPSIGQPSVISVPAFHFPNGVHVDVNPAGLAVATYDRKQAKVIVNVTEKTRPGAKIHVVISRLKDYIDY